MNDSPKRPIAAWIVAFGSVLLAVAVAWLFLGGSEYKVPEEVSQPADPAEPAGVPRLRSLPQAALKGGGQNDASIADVAAQVVPSVVNIFSTVGGPAAGSRGMPPDHPFFRRYFGQPSEPRQRQQQSLGSGVIVSEDGVILTNNHVIEKASKIRVVLADRREYSAEIAGSDPQTDLAVLKLELGAGDRVPALPLGDSGRLRLGDIVLAVGNPFGLGQTVTMGIVSAVGRANVGIADYEDFIQTDAAINPGNSGGALVDMEGHLVGVNTAILSRTGGYQGIGFAVPTKMIEPIMQSLLERGRVERGWLGVIIQDLTTEDAARLGINGERGALIAQVGRGTPAEAAGLEAGDVVSHLDGAAVESSAQLRNAVAMKGADKSVVLGLLRNGKRREVSVKLGALPAEFSR